MAPETELRPTRPKRSLKQPSKARCLGGSRLTEPGASPILGGRPLVGTLRASQTCWQTFEGLGANPSPVSFDRPSRGTVEVGFIAGRT